MKFKFKDLADACQGDTAALEACLKDGFIWDGDLKTVRNKKGVDVLPAHVKDLEWDYETSQVVDKDGVVVEDCEDIVVDTGDGS